MRQRDYDIIVFSAICSLLRLLDNQVTSRNGGSTVIFRADIFMKSEASKTLSWTAILEFECSFRVAVTFGFYFNPNNCRLSR